MSRKKYRVVTLGCRTNQYESQAFRDQLEGMDFSKADDHEEADLCIVNTCTVTANADSDSRHQIRSLARKNPNAKIVVTGCMAEREKDSVLAMEGVTHVIPNLEKDHLLNTVFPDHDIPEFSIKHFDSHTRAFVKVQDGCNSFCSYCVIPYVRGRSRSRSIPDVVKEVKDLLASGFKEVVITGINVGDFDGGKSKKNGETPDTLANLVREIDALDGLERLRISSIDPDEVDDDLLDAVVNGRKTCHSMHIVLQAGSNSVLKRMRRKYTRQMFLDTVDRLKAASPRFTFTTDIIVGFPGETEADFQETIDMVNEVKFAKVHMFPYSKRPQTLAAKYPDQVPPHISKDRKHRLLAQSEQVAFELCEQFVGQQMVVLTESGQDADPSHGSRSFGHTENFLPVWIQGSYQPNELVTVRLVSNHPDGLLGEVVTS